MSEAADDPRITAPSWKEPKALRERTHGFFKRSWSMGQFVSFPLTFFFAALATLIRVPHFLLSLIVGRGWATGILVGMWPVGALIALIAMELLTTNPQHPSHWISQALYHEARGEPLGGKLAVAAVIYNHVEHPKWPSTIEGVVRFGAERVDCDFTGLCHNSPPIPEELGAWREARFLAFVSWAVYRWLNYYPDPTDGAHSYFSLTMITPPSEWHARFSCLKGVGAHVFCHGSP